MSALVFPAERGGYIDRHNFRLREWKPAQLMAGIEPLRRMNSAPAGVHGWTTVDAAWTPPTEAAVRGDTEDSG